MLKAVLPEILVVNKEASWLFTQQEARVKAAGTFGTGCAASMWCRQK
jgi:hypothetical protein